MAAEGETNNNQTNTGPNDKPNAAQWRKCAIDTKLIWKNAGRSAFHRDGAVDFLILAANKAIIEDKAVTSLIGDSHHLSSLIDMGVIVYAKPVGTPNDNKSTYTFRFDQPPPSSLRA